MQAIFFKTSKSEKSVRFVYHYHTILATRQPGSNTDTDLDLRGELFSTLFTICVAFVIYRGCIRQSSQCYSVAVSDAYVNNIPPNI